jgi:IS4 transposase
MCVEAVKIEYDIDSSDDGVSEDLSLSGHEVKRIIPGTWNIEYRNQDTNIVQTDTTIDFNLDGTFHQKAGDYSGTWICSKKGKLKITFDNVKIGINKVVLKARVNVTNDSYRFAGNVKQFYNFVAFRD